METNEGSLNLIFYGTGADAENLFNTILFMGEYWCDKIVCIVDGDPKKQGFKFHEHKIFAPHHIQDCKFDAIVILSRKYGDEIRNLLINDFAIDGKKILGIAHYFERCCIRYQYKKNKAINASKLNFASSCKLDLSRTVFYTTIFGKYDRLKSPKIVDKNVSYICYTDDRSIRSDIWNIEYINLPQNKDKALETRKYKLLPHIQLSNYTTSVWIDASMEITGSITDYIKKYSTDAGLLLFPHPERWCIYDEGAEVIKEKKAPKIEVIKQLSHYIDKGYPKDNGLYCGGLIVSNLKDKKIGKFYEAWYSEVEKYTRRDQLSMPYAIYSNDIKIDLCDLHIFDNKYIKFYPHRN